MTSGSDIPDVPGPRVGVDDWVAEHGERRAEYSGLGGLARRALGRAPVGAGHDPRLRLLGGAGGRGGPPHLHEVEPQPGQVAAGAVLDPVGGANP